MWRGFTPEQRAAMRELARAMPERFGGVVPEGADDEDDGEAGAFAPVG